MRKKTLSATGSCCHCNKAAVFVYCSFALLVVRAMSRLETAGPAPPSLLVVCISVTLEETRRIT